MKKNIANILKGAPKGLLLWNNYLNNNVEFVRIEDVILKNNLSRSIIVCKEIDQTDNSTDDTDDKVYFDEYGRILMGHYGEWYINDDVDLLPNRELQWDGNGIQFLFFNTEHPEGTVIMDAFDEELSPVSWIIGTDYIWSCDFEQWDAVRIHKFAFDCCRFATEDETKEFFDYMHSVNLDFKDGEPIRINQETGDVVTEYRYKQKELFLNTLTDICKRWKDTISDEDYDEVIKKFIKKIKKDKS